MIGSFFSDICNLLKREHVNIYSGPKLAEVLTFGPPPVCIVKECAAHWQWSNYICVVNWKFTFFY